MRLLFLLALLGGCHKLFDLEVVKLDPTGDGGTQDSAIDAPLPDASRACPSALEFDEDGDSIDDRCDPCPTIPSDNLDADGDGLPNACDHDLAQADTILFWTTFYAPSEVGAFVRTNATWDDEHNGSVQLAASGSMLLTPNLAPLEIEVNVVGLDATTSSTLTVGMTTQIGCEVRGSACGSNDGASTCARLQPSSSQVDIGVSSPALERVRLYQAGDVWCTIRGASINGTANAALVLGVGNVQITTSAGASTRIKSIVVYGAQ